MKKISVFICLMMLNTIILTSAQSLNNETLKVSSGEEKAILTKNTQKLEQKGVITPDGLEVDCQIVQDFGSATVGVPCYLNKTRMYIRNDGNYTVDVTFRTEDGTSFNYSVASGKQLEKTITMNGDKGDCSIILNSKGPLNVYVRALTFN